MTGATTSSTSSSELRAFDDSFTSMEALHSHINEGQVELNNIKRVRVLPTDIDPFKPKPSKTNPNVMFKRPSSLSSMMYWLYFNPTNMLPWLCITKRMK